MSSVWGVWVPTWLEAVGTVGAFATGGALLFREIRRDRDREDRVLRQRASTFAVWPERVPDERAGVDAVAARLRLSNLGGEPVYDVTVEYRQPPAAPVEDQIGMVPPGQHDRALPPAYDETWVRTGSGWQRQGQPDTGTVDDPYRQTWGFAVAVHFTDASGTRWHRAPHGEVHRSG